LSQCSALPLAPEACSQVNSSGRLARTSLTFLLHAEDDPVDPVENLLVYDAALRKAGVPAEVHISCEGGHAFGLRATDAPITHWTGLVERWLESAGVLSK
jgi:acetyl esterase/lipase